MFTMNKKFDSIVGKSICEFNTEEIFKFRCVSTKSDFTIYVKEIGLEKFISFLKMKCSDKYGSCEAIVNDKNSILTISPTFLSPYLSFELTPSTTFLPAILGNYSCALSPNLIAAGHLKYFLGLSLPSIDYGFHFRENYLGNKFETKLISEKGKYQISLYDELYLTDDNNKGGISVSFNPGALSKFMVSFVNKKTYLSLNCDTRKTIKSKIYKEIPISSYTLGFRSRFKKPFGDPLQKWFGLGIKIPNRSGYLSLAFNSELKFSTKLKFKIAGVCELSSTLRISNWKCDDPKLGVSVCVFPDDKLDIDPQNLQKIYKPAPMFFM